MTAYGFLAVALLSTALSQFLLKLYHVRSKIYLVVLALCLFGSIPVFSYLALRELELSTVYVSTAITQVMVLFLSKQFLHEKITQDMAKSIGLILAGIVVFAI